MFLPWLEAHQQWIKIPHKSSRNVLRAVVDGEMIWTSCENGTLTLSQRVVTPCTARVSPHSRSVLSWKHLCIFSEELSALTERQTLGNIMDKWKGRWMKRWWGECDWLSEGSNIKLILLFFHPDGSYNNVVSVILVHAHSKHTVFFFLTSWFIEWLFSQRAETRFLHVSHGFPSDFIWPPQFITESLQKLDLGEKRLSPFSQQHHVWLFWRKDAPITPQRKPLWVW